MILYSFMCKLIKRSLVENTSIILWLCVLAVALLIIDYFFSNRPFLSIPSFIKYLWDNHNSYIQWIITNIIWAIITLFFVDIRVKARDEKNEKENLLKQLSNIDILLSQYIEKYIYYAKCITSPDFNEDTTLEKWFDFKRLSAIFNPTLLITHDGIDKKAFHYYFETQEDIVDLIRMTLVFINFKGLQDLNWLQELFLDYIKVVWWNSLFDWISSNYTTIYKDPKTWQEVGKTKDAVIQLIKEWKWPIVTQQPTNMINLYILLYKQINYNLDFIQKYKEYKQKALFK